MFDSLRCYLSWSDVMGTKCELSRAEWAKASDKKLAKDILAKFNEGLASEFDCREFGTGSFGGFVAGKVSMVIAGKPVTFQCNLLCTVVGSKQAV